MVSLSLKMLRTLEMVPQKVHRADETQSYTIRRIPSDLERSSLESAYDSLDCIVSFGLKKWHHIDRNRIISSCFIRRMRISFFLGADSA